MKKKTGFKEHANRSIVKALTFRALIILTGSFLIFGITRNVNQTLSLVILSNIANTILYIIHERIWNKITWGKT